MMERNKSLKELHTFGISVQAGQYTKIKNEVDLLGLLPINIPFMVLGGGSNVLFTQDFEGLIIQNEIKGIRLVSENENSVLVEVGGGEVWHEFVLWTIEHNFAGIENLSLIPGSVGAAPIQNIGAYGVELKDVFHSLEAINYSTGKKEVFDKDACVFGYRDSVFKRALKGKYCITKVCFKLAKKPVFHISYGAIKKVLETSDEPLSIRRISDAVIKIRTEKLPDPKVIGNSGSFFKNPVVDKNIFAELQLKHPQIPNYPQEDGRVKLAAGWLIDQLGWKGFREGDAGVHENQALVLVNYSNAEGQEILTLAKKIQASVQEHFGINLEAEVNII